MDAFQAALPKLKALADTTDGPYVASGKYEKIVPQAQIWAPTLTEAQTIKEARGDCDHWTFPKEKFAGFTDFENGDGKE